MSSWKLILKHGKKGSPQCNIDSNFKSLEVLSLPVGWYKIGNLKQTDEVWLIDLYNVTCMKEEAAMSR